MKKIKFRIWDLENKEMEYDVENTIALKHGVLTDYGKFIIMQFTGIEDKNQREIYEGDIITCRDGKGVVIYEDSFAKFIIDFNYFGKNTLPDFEAISDNHEDADTCRRSIEVIGNIYQNPELLKK